jgi:type IV fimbrial biogenesis protein FimT
MNASSYSPAAGFSRTGRRAYSTGFSLVEVVAVLAVATILLGAAVPAMTATMKSIKLSSASNDLLASLLMARSEAGKRKGRGVICKSPDGVSCATTGGWEQGWIVFHDANNNGIREFNEAVLQHEQALPKGLLIRGNLNVARYVSYAPSGGTKLIGGGFQAGTLTLCNQSADSGEARQIILNSTGRPRVQKVTLSACA